MRPTDAEPPIPPRKYLCDLCGEKIERPETGLAVLVLDPPHRKLAVLDLPLMRDLERELDRLANDASLKGLVITGRAPTSFAAGADIDALGTLEDERVVSGVGGQYNFVDCGSYPGANKPSDTDPANFENPTP